jgi:predicted HAD superfamily Cof-like phosphohydrolase
MLITAPRPGGVGFDQRVIHLEDLHRDVEAFHYKFGIAYTGKPRELPEDYHQFRAARLEEEAREYREAKNLAERLDAIIDTIYIAIGSAHLHGFDNARFYEAWRRVQTANMAKERASKANPGKYKVGMDIVKPPGWTAPDLSDLLV